MYSVIVAILFPVRIYSNSVHCLQKYVVFVVVLRLSQPFNNIYKTAGRAQELLIKTCFHF